MTDVPISGANSGVVSAFTDTMHFPCSETPYGAISDRFVDGAGIKVAAVAANAGPLATVASTAASNLAAAQSSINVDIAALQAADIALAAVNTTQTGNIATNASAISALQGITGGLSTPAASNANPLALAVAAAQGASTRYSRQDHQHVLPPWTLSAPARALNGTAWQPSTTKYVLCVYSVKIAVTSTIGSGQDGKVELMSDSASTPTTVRCTAQNRNVVTLAIALQVDNAQTVTLIHMCPPGDYVRLPTTNTVGTPTFTLVNSLEIPFG